MVSLCEVKHIQQSISHAPKVKKTCLDNMKSQTKPKLIHYDGR